MTDNYFDHSKHLKDEYFTQVASGIKISEARLHKKSASGVKKNHIIKFHNDNGDECFAKVVGISHYRSFLEMLNNELHNVLPECDNVENGLAIYREIYPSEEEEKKLGVVVFHIELKG